jgi:shikimate kinase
LGESITLVGMMGAGKTTVGRALASRRGWRFFDSDDQVEAMTGHTVADIWREQGEAGFRRLEAQVLADAMSSTTPHVIAAAGGVVLDPNNRRILTQNPPVVWLRSRPQTLAGRVGTGTHRPLLDVDPAGTLARLEEERRPHYEEVATVVVDVDDLSADEVVERIEALLARG